MARPDRAPTDVTEAAGLDTDDACRLLWTMTYCKVVPEGAAAASVAALLEKKLDLAPGTRVCCVLSGGNLDLSQLNGLTWN